MQVTYTGDPERPDGDTGRTLLCACPDGTHPATLHQGDTADLCTQLAEALTDAGLATA